MPGKRMIAALFYKPQLIRLEEVSVPTIGKEDILVKVEVALTCGTDVKMYRRGHSLTSRLPMVIGHEFAGVVDEVGSEVETFKPGQRVVAANSAPCNNCFYCKHEKQNLCVQLKENLLGFSIPGAYAQYIRVPASIVKQNTYIIPEHVSFREAALLEPLACVTHGNDLAGIVLGDTVAILGAGPIGLLHLQLAKIKGAGETIMIDLMQARLDKAQNLGADHVVDASKEDDISKVKELTKGHGADVVIEAAGLPATWRKALEMTRRGGTVIFFGGCPSGSTVELSTEKIHYQELTLKGVFHHTPKTVEKAFNLICSRAVKAAPFITNEAGLESVGEALQMMAEGRSLKTAIFPAKIKTPLRQ